MKVIKGVRTPGAEVNVADDVRVSNYSKVENWYAIVLLLPSLVDEPRRKQV